MKTRLFLQHSQASHPHRTWNRPIRMNKKPSQTNRKQQVLESPSQKGQCPFPSTHLTIIPGAGWQWHVLYHMTQFLLQGQLHQRRVSDPRVINFVGGQGMSDLGDLLREHDQFSFFTWEPGLGSLKPSWPAVHAQGRQCEDLTYQPV